MALVYSLRFVRIDSKHVSRVYCVCIEFYAVLRLYFAVVVVFRYFSRNLVLVVQSELRCFDGRIFVMITSLRYVLRLCKEIKQSANWNFQKTKKLYAFSINYFERQWVLLQNRKCSMWALELKRHAHTIYIQTEYEFESKVQIDGTF